MSEAFNSIKQGLTEAIAFAQGEPGEAIVHECVSYRQPGNKFPDWYKNVLKHVKEAIRTCFNRFFLTVVGFNQRLGVTSKLDKKRN